MLYVKFYCNISFWQNHVTDNFDHVNKNGVREVQ